MYTSPATIKARRSLTALLALLASASAATGAHATRGSAPSDHVGAETRATIDREWLRFPDSTKYEVAGLHWFDENKPQLYRMPKSRFETLPDGVKRTCKAPSGGRIIINCDTSTLLLRVKALNKGNRKGFDVYVDGKPLHTAVAEEPGKEADLLLFEQLDRRPKRIVVYLPTQQDVLISAVGVDTSTKFEPPVHKYARPLPVVFYGSSVCQGNGTMKSGMTYEAILCRELNLDFINLGFGGAGKAEKAVVNLVNSIPACCYVFDLGKSYGAQDMTAYKAMLTAVRKSHPDVPIICITPITSAREVQDKTYSERSLHTRKVMRDAAVELIASGETNVHLVEGPDLLGFKDHAGLSKDGVHPSERGYELIAQRLLPTLRKALGL